MDDDDDVDNDMISSNMTAAPIFILRSQLDPGFTWLGCLREALLFGRLAFIVSIYIYLGIGPLTFFPFPIKVFQVV